MKNSNETAISVVEIKKQQYIAEILQELYQSGANTIAQLAKKLHTSVPSITVFVNELLRDGWLEELGAIKTKSGRRPSLYDINASKHKILVIDINFHNVIYTLIDLRNNIKEQEIQVISIQVDNLIDEILAKTSAFIKGKKLWAVCVISPGLVNLESGLNLTYSNLNKGDKSFASIISENLALPTFITHDTQVSIYGEHYFGLAKGKENVLLVNIDWGVGLGILSNGIIIKGENGYAGELGHIQIKPDGVLCHCGKKGCLETVASASALIAKAKAGLKEGKASVLALLKTEIQVEDIISAALSGDEFSIDLIIEIGNELGKGLSIAVHMFNPEMIVIQGILTTASELIVSTLSQSINKYCLFNFKKDLQILVSPISKEARIYGANSLVFNKMIESKDFS